MQRSTAISIIKTYLYSYVQRRFVYLQRIHTSLSSYCTSVMLHIPAESFGENLTIPYLHDVYSYPMIWFSRAWFSMYSCSLVEDEILNTTGITFRIGFCFCRHRIQDNKESLLDVPVAHIAKYMPSFCSWTVGGRITSRLSQNGILMSATSAMRANAH